MPPQIAEIRRKQCRRAGCEQEHDFTDPCAACAAAGWGAYSLDCRSAEPAKPSLSRMALNYTVAQLKDLAAGRPRRTEEEEAAIERICRSCPKFRKSDASCSVCGCPIARKAPLAQESCPIGKW